MPARSGEPFDRGLACWRQRASVSAGPRRCRFQPLPWARRGGRRFWSPRRGSDAASWITF